MDNKRISPCPRSVISNYGDPVNKDHLLRAPESESTIAPGTGFTWRTCEESRVTRVTLQCAAIAPPQSQPSGGGRPYGANGMWVCAAGPNFLPGYALNAANVGDSCRAADARRASRNSTTGVRRSQTERGRPVVGFGGAKSHNRAPLPGGGFFHFGRMRTDCHDCIPFL